MKRAWFHILLALSAEELHGYGVRRAVSEQTDGELILWPASLYRTLGALEERSLIRSASPPNGGVTDGRRRYYAITADGRARLHAEAQRMAGWAQSAVERTAGLKGGA